MPGQLDRSDFIKTAHIEAWADESVTMHRRECTEKVCGGKSKIWWLVRHPKINPVISNPTARSLAIGQYHVCAELLKRLVGGSVPWLPHEKRTYQKREPEEIARLLGREVYSAEPISEPDPTTEELRNPFPEVRKSFPETKTERYRRERAEQQETASADTPRRQAQRASHPNGMAAAVDALTRRG